MQPKTRLGIKLFRMVSMIQDGYSSQYTDECGRCNRISCKFLYYFTFNLQESLESNKQDFVKHWNEKHNQSIYSF